jgi:membrane protein required for colicin V production
MEGLPFNFADVAVLAVLLVSGIFAFIRGFVHEALAVVAWIGAALATVHGIDYVIPLARKLTTMQTVADIGSGVLIFLVVLIALTVLTRYLSRRVQASALSTLDRSLGLVFGILRGAVLICIAWLIVSWALPRRDLPEAVIEARSLPLVDQGKDLLLALVPADMRPRAAPANGTPEPDATQSFEQLVRPPAKATGPDDTSGYNDEQRKDMERLIESSQ